MKDQLRALHLRRPVFVERSTEGFTMMAEVKWPASVEFIKTFEVPDGIRLVGIGCGEKCECVGDCFIHSCTNAQLTIYCTPGCCGMRAACSNTPQTLYSPKKPSPLRLYVTERVGLGVFTTIYIKVGDVVGEYAGMLCEYDAIVEGQPTRALKENCGYTMLLHAKSVKNKYVYVEALEYESITRFTSHACEPNVQFVEVQKRTTVKVMAVMLKTVRPGSQLTVNYGNDICSSARMISVGSRHRQVNPFVL
ncbi:unnamed protein product [Phytophthora fragariaefolia]|uniref:Unnamed protein product n=1 Tax=Phytophthora fragariaefolia TaxID=1490495 RepID=A0A9W7D1B0_9STRA|nr:unnamed protein product [Phytophthora fragariaefolia]